MSFILFENNVFEIYSSGLNKILIGPYFVEYCCATSILFKYKINNKK